MDGGADGAAVLHEQRADVGAERIGEAHVHHDAFAEEGARPGLGAVVELVGHDHVERLANGIAVRLGVKGAVQVSRLAWNLLQGYGTPKRKGGRE